MPAPPYYHYNKASYTSFEVEEVAESSDEDSDGEDGSYHKQMALNSGKLNVVVSHPLLCTNQYTDTLQLLDPNRPLP
jgi:hypothetical protein